MTRCTRTGACGWRCRHAAQGVGGVWGEEHNAIAVFERGLGFGVGRTKGDLDVEEHASVCRVEAVVIEELKATLCPGQVLLQAGVT